MKIVIDKDATVHKIYEKEFDDELGLTHQRASHVEPVNPVLRALFHFIRRWVHDTSILADFTRLWPCKWRARIFDGPTLGPFNRRSDAIGAEVEHIENQLVKG